MNKALIIFAAFALTACSSTPESLEGSKTAVRAERSYAENYQEVYRRVSSLAKRCATASTGSYTSLEVDAELYSELGYGEVTHYLSNLGAKNYYWKAKITKTGSGSHLSIVSGNTLAQGRTLSGVLRWADGDQAC